MNPYWFMKCVYTGLIALIVLMWIITAAIVSIMAKRPDAPDPRPVYRLLREVTIGLLGCVGMLGLLHHAILHWT